MRIKKAWFALIAGSLLGIGFIFPILWPCAFFGAALLIYLIVQTPSFLNGVMYGYIGGIVMTMCALGPIAWGSLPLDWYGIGTPFIQIVVIIGTLLYGSLMLGIPTALFGVSIRFLKTGTWSDIFVFPSVWVLCESLGTFLFYIAFFGPGSLFGTHFTLHFVGYQLASDSVLLQSAWLGGIYILSFIVICVGTLIWKCLSSQEERSKRKQAQVLCVLLFLWVLCHLVFLLPTIAEEQGEHIQVGVVSRYMPPALVQNSDFIEARFREMQTLITPLRDIDVLVFSEGTSFLWTLRNGQHDHVYKTLETIGTTKQSPLIIDSEDVFNERGSLNSQATSFYGGKHTVFSQKQFLLPLGEYIPTVYQFIVKLSGGTKLLESIVKNRGYEPGTAVSTVSLGAIQIAVRFCDEAMSPLLYRQQVQEGAQVLVDISSLSWFHGSPTMYEQMKRVAKVRAVESGRWFIQSANMSPAFVINTHGEVVAETPWNKPEVLTATVTPKHTRTPYILIGPWILLIFVGIVCIGAWKKFLHKM